MPIRLIDVFLPQQYEKAVDGALEDRAVLGRWRETQSGGLVHIQVLVETPQAEGVLDGIEHSLVGVKDFRIVVLPVVASIPRPEPPPQGPASQGTNDKKAKQKPPLRISREELYAGILQTVNVSPVFIVLVILSSVVAAIGLLRGSPAVIIAAMVIAPMLGPNMALSLSVTLADLPLAVKAIRAEVAGTAAALAFSVLAGLLLNVDPSAAEVASRTHAYLGDVILALASGVAGALAFTTNQATWLVGVMVAAALLPPLVTGGMLVAAGRWREAGGALLLFLTNVICVNLAAVGTFVLQGIRPRTWWEASKAKRATRIALFLWGGMLALLVTIILLWQRHS